MNGLAKKLLVFLLLMTLVAAVSWYGRKAYKNAMERSAITEAGHYLKKRDLINAHLCLQRALQVNPVSVPAAKMMADMLESAGLPAALEWRIRASQLQPNNMTNRLLWAQTAIKSRDFKSASDALGALDEKSKSTAMYLKLSGALAWNLGQAVTAEKYYREALRLEPTNLVIVLNLDSMGLASTNSEIANAARLSLERVATNSEVRLIALRFLTVDASAHKSYAKAAKYSAEIVQDPEATVGDKIEYLELLHRANSADFTPWLASMKQAATNSAANAFALGKWMAMTDNPTDALRWLESLPSSIQTNQPTPLIIADCHVALKDWNGLLALLEKQDWGDANCFRLAMVSLAQRSLNQESAAQVSWHKATRLSTRRLDHLVRLAQVTASWGWDMENIEVLKTITSDFPKEKWATDQLASKYYAAGNTRELKDLTEKIYAADTSNPRSKNNLANIDLLRKVDLAEAHRLAREAYQSSPENPFFISTYAYSLLLQNKHDEALKVFSNLKPEYLQIPSVAAYYGVVEAQSGHEDVAKAALKRAAAARLLPEEKEMVRLAQSRL